jgi:hypothetical protein
MSARHDDNTFTRIDAFTLVHSTTFHYYSSKESKNGKRMTRYVMPIGNEYRPTWARGHVNLGINKCPALYFNKRTKYTHKPLEVLFLSLHMPSIAQGIPRKHGQEQKQQA